MSTNVERLMKARGLTAPALSAELGRLGRPILPTGITKIIKGGRRVDVDDLMALALALRVNPNALLLPNDTRWDTRYDITGADGLPPHPVWDWAEGAEPLFVPADDDGEAFADFQTYARPRGRRQYRSVADMDRDTSPVLDEELPPVAVADGEEKGPGVAFYLSLTKDQIRLLQEAEQQAQAAAESDGER